MCSKRVGGYFLVYSSLTSIVRLKCFYYEFYETSMKGCFLNCFFLVYSKLYKTSADGCFLVYSLNFVRLPLTTAFDLTEISYLIYLNIWDFSLGSFELRFQF